MCDMFTLRLSSVTKYGNCLNPPAPPTHPPTHPKKKKKRKKERKEEENQFDK